MNIIEAWKLAKVGQRLRRNFRKNLPAPIIKGEGSDCLSMILSTMFDAAILADDWEVVKEPTHGKIETVWSDITPLISPFVTCKYDFPKDAKVTIEWGEPMADHLVTKCEGPRSSNGKCGRKSCYNCY